MRATGTLAIALALAALPIARTPAAADQPTTTELAGLAESDRRVAAVGLRLLIASAPRCPRQMPATGLVLHGLNHYAAAVQAEAQRLWQFPSAVAVHSVVPGGPAAQAGVRAGDGIEQLDGQPLPRPAGPATAARDAVEQAIARHPLDRPLALGVRRNGALLTLAVPIVAACRVRLELVAGSGVIARSDGATIQIGQHFAERLDDAGLAVVLAHEIAHSMADHRAALARLERNPGRAARLERRRLARQFEDEADLLSLVLLRAAGWDPALAPRFMRREGNRFGPSGGSAHRSAAERAARMERALAAGAPPPG